MLKAYGPQHWWPAETRFEVMVGAVLTQAVSWTNVEKAVSNLKSAGALSPDGLRETPSDTLAGLIHSTGYYNAKAQKLKALAEYLGRRFGDDLDAMAREPLATLRAELRSVHGIGEETADDILLYALDRPVFVIDAMTQRLLFRLGLAPETGTYASYQSIFASHLPPEAELFKEYHALIDHHGSEVCKRSQPLCRDCCLLEVCPTGRENVRARSGPS